MTTRREVLPGGFYFTRSRSRGRSRRAKPKNRGGSKSMRNTKKKYFFGLF